MTRRSRRTTEATLVRAGLLSGATHSVDTTRESGEGDTDASLGSPFRAPIPPEELLVKRRRSLIVQSMHFVQPGQDDLPTVYSASCLTPMTDKSADPASLATGRGRSAGGLRAGGVAQDAEHELQAFLASLGAALSAIGETVDAVELRLAGVARAYGLHDARFSVFPTSLLLTLGHGRAATIEPTTRLSATPRLDQIAAVHVLAEQAEHGLVAPSAGIARLEEIRTMGDRFGTVASLLGYATLTIGIALVLHPAPRDVVAAGMLGALVGVLRRLGHGRRTIEVLMPFLAAFCVAALTALLVEARRDRPRASGDDRLAGRVHPRRGADDRLPRADGGTDDRGLEPPRLGRDAARSAGLRHRGGNRSGRRCAERAFSSSDAVLGRWAPWLGVLVFAIGVTIAHSAPPGAFVSLLVVLYAAWTGQVVGTSCSAGT